MNKKLISLFRINKGNQFLYTNRTASTFYLVTELNSDTKKFQKYALFFTIIGSSLVRLLDRTFVLLRYSIIDIIGIVIMMLVITIIANKQLSKIENQLLFVEVQIENYDTHEIIRESKMSLQVSWRILVVLESFFLMSSVCFILFSSVFFLIIATALWYVIYLLLRTLRLRDKRRVITILEEKWSR